MLAWALVPAAGAPAADRTQALTRSAGTSTAAPAVDRAGSGDDGIFGVQDPTYDGVYRQSLAIGGLIAGKVDVPSAAVDWLARQQCANGSFQSYRADTSVPCAPAGSETNSTANAVQALAALGTPVTEAAAGRAVAWLRTVQNPDGGVGFQAGSATDANSTGLFLNALVADGVDPTTVRAPGGSNPYDALITLQVGCTPNSRDPADIGGLAYQPQDGELNADTFATSGALLGFAGGAFPVTPRSGTREVPAPNCPAARRPAPPVTGTPTSTARATNTPVPTSIAAPTDTSTPASSATPTAGSSGSPGLAGSSAPTDPPSASTTGEPRTAVVVRAAGYRGRAARPAVLTGDPVQAARLAGGYLARNIAASHGLVQYTGKPSVGQTLTAVLGLVRLGIAADQVEQAVAALPAALPGYVTDDAGADRPGSLGQAALTIAAVGARPTAFHGVDYPARTLATLQVAAAAPSPTASTSPTRTRTASPTATASARPTPAPTNPEPTASAPTAPASTPTSSAARPVVPAPTDSPAPTGSPTPTPPGSGYLPRTGSSLTLPLTGAGLAAMAVGALLVLLGRQRR